MISRPTVLLVLDGWGIAPETRGNAIALAATPAIDRLVATYPTMAVQAAGEAVGLPWGEVGNSEVGHLNIGAGKIIYQDLPRINKAISDGTFFSNKAFLQAVAHVRSQKSRLHLVGLVSSGGIHSFHEHLYALLEFAAQQQVANVAVHAFLDGRDTPYNSGKTFLTKLEKELKKRGGGAIASLAGRYYAMDRDRHWDRTRAAYDAMLGIAGGRTAANAATAIEASYAAKVFDEEFSPTTIVADGQAPVAKISDGDAVIFFNFRNDRMRQIARAFALPAFHEFARSRVCRDLYLVTMTEYEAGLPVIVAFPPDYIKTPLVKVLADAGCRQLHIAETEKYAHVTFFLNGGREEPFPNEKRALISSPHVPSYDLKPEMSARGITEKIVEELNAGTFTFIVANYANADMVGHTGNMAATIKAVEFLDACIGQIVDATLAHNGVVVITADHGNAEDMVNLQTGEMNKEHTANSVPAIFIDRQWEGQGLGTRRDLASLTPIGFLSDIAPTILRIMGIPQPADMTGRCLLLLPAP